jgi:hypothetical protein
VSVRPIVLLKPAKGSKPDFRLRIRLPTSPIDSVSFFVSTMTLATHVLSHATPLRRIAARPWVAGVPELIRLARPSAADRRLEITVQE